MAMARKSEEELHPTMVRLPEGLRRKLEELAAFYGRSLNNEIIYRLLRSYAEEKAGKEQAREDATTLSKESMSVRLDRIERTLESYERLLRAQQKVAHDALAALAKASAKTSDPVSVVRSHSQGEPLGLTFTTKDESK
jgi:Arc-like DNA binding domain